MPQKSPVAEKSSSVRSVSGGPSPGKAALTPASAPPGNPGIPPRAGFTSAESLKQLARSLSLPPDNLSAALLTFARHFSLPLDPALLSRLRREVLSLKVPRDAAALAAVAAADKGVQLTPEALERYAAALEAEPPPEPFKDNDGGAGQQYGAGHHNQDEGQDQGQNNRDADKPDTESAESDGPELEILKKVLQQIEKINQNGQTGGESSLISILNRLPGRNGGYWMVYPFNFLADNIDFRVSVRISLNDGAAIAKKAPGSSGDGRNCYGSPCRRIAVDIAAVDPEHAGRRWLFILNNPGGPGAETRFSLSPALSEAAGKRLEREVRETLGPFCGPVRLVPGRAFADIEDEGLLYVNEEV